jgi:HSP20 family protein
MWYPWTSEFDRWVSFADLFRQADRALHPEAAAATHDPGALLLETPTGYEFRVEVPGVSQDELTLDVHDQTLTLSAKRSIKAREGWSVHRAERQAFSWKRSYSLPTKLDAERSKATLKDGVLTVSVAKAPEDQPRRVQIGAS